MTWQSARQRQQQSSGMRAKGCKRLQKCRDPGSNQGPSDLQSDALPTELSRRQKPTLLISPEICHARKHATTLPTHPTGQYPPPPLCRLPSQTLQPLIRRHLDPHNTSKGADIMSPSRRRALFSDAAASPTAFWGTSGRHWNRHTAAPTRSACIRIVPDWGSNQVHADRLDPTNRAPYWLLYWLFA
jgi:hypothetical protein